MPAPVGNSRGQALEKRYVVYLFQQAFQQFNFGFAAAMAWLLFVILVILTFVQVKIGNRFVYYEGER